MIDILAAVYISGLLIYALVKDVLHLRIPNGVSIALILGFFVYAVLSQPEVKIGAHLIAAGLTFLATFTFFLFGWFGGGDIKLITALMLWVGPDHSADFLVRTTIFGGVLGVIVLIARHVFKLYPQFALHFPEAGLLTWARKGKYPYSVPIVAAALTVFPTILSL